MEGFSYNNIFDTKGIEYLIIIAFLLLIIPFWVAINRKEAIKKGIRKAIGVLSAGVLRVPLGLFYSLNHSWTHLERSGVAKVGLDDFLMHVTGDIAFRELKAPGNFINKGEVIADIDQNGKTLQIYSPISGRVVKTNASLSENPALISEDPYEKGWIYEVMPSDWAAETEDYYLGNDAVAWVKSEIDKFKDFLSSSLRKHMPDISPAVLQDGGELIDTPLSGLPDEVWQDFQKDFLNRKF